MANQIGRLFIGLKEAIHIARASASTHLRRCPLTQSVEPRHSLSAACRARVVCPRLCLRAVPISDVALRENLVLNQTLCLSTVARIIE